ncbi:OHCU decarboxylase [Bacillus sp. AFS043905]|uniref:2-oxo-4-hydroxy-4-carboxy-5-ureidoimidazoline decarboxylase n=1 Tax=Peribacillus frigoritolerans TaxID=450367 RepID=UPI000BFB73BE|nr:2-oxo-4-hydroxy-4-carboxy-5-ureidoimidazoline decarboxylase [Peribacillus frigoritolerans]PHD71561.1 OHCU decarboxylase [Bacillus sp. AFS043905]TWE03420.1 2-oxo-4-hydroxy-4-carboxy-5-ureidoimidazoline decarboxylase [Peribacillus frigoritolerans]
MIHATLNALNEIPLSEFVEKLKDIFEHSPWVAQRAGEFRPFSSCESLYERMVNVVQTASEEEKLNLIHAHPHLGKTMSSFSQSELKTAGLSQLSEAEYKLLLDNFPLILTVRGINKDEILQAMEDRLKNSKEHVIHHFSL